MFKICFQDVGRLSRNSGTFCTNNLDIHPGQMSVTASTEKAEQGTAAF